MACPCGLTSEALISLPHLVGPGGVCTAFKKGSRTEYCGELLADHPHQQPSTPVTFAAGLVPVVKEVVKQYLTPSPRKSGKKTSHRGSTKQRNMRSHVMERNRLFWYNGDEKRKPNHYKCDICRRETNKSSDYINSHIVAHAHARSLFFARRTNPNLPSSPSYDYTGLFLCGECDGHFEDHLIEIDGDGTIRITGDPLPRNRYQSLKGTKVAWAELIGKSPTWPNAAVLEFRKTLAPVCGAHRQSLFGVEDDDRSLASEEEEDEEETRGRKRPSKQNPLPLTKKPKHLYTVKKEGCGGRSRHHLHAIAT